MGWRGTTVRDRMHLYLVYALFGIPASRWGSCVVWQRAIDSVEEKRINAYLKATTER